MRAEKPCGTYTHKHAGQPCRCIKLCEICGYTEFEHRKAAGHDVVQVNTEGTVVAEFSSTPTYPGATLKYWTKAQVLSQHEIQHLTVSPQPVTEGNRCNGFDLTIAQCMCGNSSPLGSRTVHLDYVLSQAGY